MTTEALQSVKLPTALLERAAAMADEWNVRDGVTVWSRATVLRCLLSRAMSADHDGGQLNHAMTTARPRHDHRGGQLNHGAPKETRARTRKRAPAAAGAGGNKNTSVVSPELTSGAATPPPPTADLQENQASATPARDAHTHAYEPAVEVPASAAGRPRSGTTEIEDHPTPERPPPRALRVIDGGASDEPAFVPLTPEEEAAIFAEGTAKLERMRAAHQADLAEKAEKRRIAAEAWRANEDRKAAELAAYYERNPNGRGVPT